MNLLIYTTKFIPFSSGVVNRIKFFLDYNYKNKVFNNIVIVTPDKECITTYNRYPVIKLNSIKLLSQFSGDDHNKIYFIDFTNKNLIRALEFIVKKYEINYFHLYQSDISNYYFTYIANKYNIKTMYSWHTDIFKTMSLNKNNKDNFVQKLFFKLSCIKNMDLYTTSNSSKEYLETYYNNKIKILPYFINSKYFYPIKKVKKKKFTILYICRIEFEKNIEELVKLFDYFDFQLLLVGTGSKLQYYREKYHDKDIILFGNINNNLLVNYYNYADVYINPSKSETLGLTTLEAMACKTLVIGRNENGTRDIIQHNHTGLLYNNIDELKYYIDLIINKKRNFDYLINNAFEYIKDNNCENYFNYIVDELKQANVPDKLSIIQIITMKILILFYKFKFFD